MQPVNVTTGSCHEIVFKMDDPDQYTYVEKYFFSLEEVSILV